jgi:hypothetical protein
MNNILPVHQRMAELYTVNQMRELDIEEITEMSLLLKANANYVWEAAYIENIKFMDSMIYNDVNYLDEISLEDKNELL